MIPLRDDNPTVLWPIFTVTFILANIAVFFYQLSLLSVNERLAEKFIYQMGMVPAALTYGRVPGAGGYYTVVTSMFLHGSLLHLGGNMLYLWIFGNNIEDMLGHGRFVVFYMMSGAAAAAAQTALSTTSSVPMIGASGAVSGVLGAYLLLFPRANVLTLVVFGFFVRVVRVPAIFVLGLWFVVQFVSGLATWGAATARGEAVGGETAWFAHLGGFLAGMVLLFAIRPRNPGGGRPGRSW